jgi:K+-sensing histidine kinase KdpD
MVEGRAIGTMITGFAGPHEFTSEEEGILFALSRLFAQALERARLFEAERAARAEAEAAERRQSFLAEASAIFSSSLDYEKTLVSLAELCVPFLGDWCSVDMLENGRVRRVAVVHKDPEKVEIANRLAEQHPPDLESDSIMATSYRTAVPMLISNITEEMVRQQTNDPEQAEAVLELGLHSVMVVPLKSGRKTLGMLSLATAESSREYTQADLELAEELGYRAALAVENARLFGESQEIQEELRRANEAKDEFLGMVSHELRTPITTIYGGARLLRARGNNLDVNSRAEVLADIEQESERLHRIVEDLLVLARIELGQEVVTEPVLVQRVVERTVSAFGKRRPGRTVEVRTTPDTPAVRASAIYLEQVLRNLIVNADKYSPPEAPIDVQTAMVDNAVTVSVLDRGPGIPAEELDLIFERFYRAAGTAKQAGGAGIGLTVCKRLIEAQSGRIWASERQGGGLAVSFALPVYSSHE